MDRAIAPLLGLLLLRPVPAFSQQVAQVHLTYDTYAAGLHVMQMNADVGLGPWTYQINVDYHTTGMVGALVRGRQTNTVRGLWNDGHASPLEFFGEGTWRGQQRRTLIEYLRGQPLIKELQPPEGMEREAVPAELILNTTDTLSALAQLVRRVDQVQSCETEVHTYDGRSVFDVVAHTVGREQLEPTGLSVFSGVTLRCDFAGRKLAGFLRGQDDADHRQPLHGSAWLAPLLRGAPPLPVRIAFQTRWFGWATMYLTVANNASLNEVAHE